MRLDLSLLESCDTCGGGGTVRWYADVMPCPRCDGAGSMLTEHGWEVRRFLEFIGVIKDGEERDL